jgi:hypothetical protein
MSNENETYSVTAVDASGRGKVQTADDERAARKMARAWRSHVGTSAAWESWDGTRTEQDSQREMNSEAPFLGYPESSVE